MFARVKRSFNDLVFEQIMPWAFAGERPFFNWLNMQYTIRTVRRYAALRKKENQ